MPAQAANQPAKLLTIGGSDSGGAAGIQADLKTWTALGVYGMSAITAVTAQNSVEVTAVHYLLPDFVAAQIDAVLSDYGAKAIKTGFIGKSELIKVIGRKLEAYRPQYLLIDPVLVNHKKQAMFSAEVITAYCDHLLPLATLITPNWNEALLLSQLPPATEQLPQKIDSVLSALHEIGHSQILITGIEQGDTVQDVYSSGTQIERFMRPRIDTSNRHGSGDTLSAAICAYLAQGRLMPEAISMAQQFTAGALAAAKDWKMGRGHGPLSHFAVSA